MVWTHRTLVLIRLPQELVDTKCGTGDMLRIAIVARANESRVHIESCELKLTCRVAHKVFNGNAHYRKFPRSTFTASWIPGILNRVLHTILTGRFFALGT